MYAFLGDIIIGAFIFSLLPNSVQTALRIFLAVFCTMGLIIAWRLGFIGFFFDMIGVMFGSVGELVVTFLKLFWFGVTGHCSNPNGCGVL